MTHILTFAIVLLTAVASFGLYQLSYEVQRQEDELSELNRAITQDRENMLVLQAEWSYLARPDNLQARAARLLELRPMMPKQVVSAADLPTLQERLRADPNAPAVASAKQKAGKPSLAMVPVMNSSREPATFRMTP